MEKIEDVFVIHDEIQNEKLVVFINATGVKLTELRKLSFLAKMDNYLTELLKRDISTFYFVFDLNKAKIPTNFSFITGFSKLLLKHAELIESKLEFSVILNKSNVFYTFFSLFKKFYVPIKPLYLCQKYDDVITCIHNRNERKKFPEIVSKMKNSN